MPSKKEVYDSVENRRYTSTEVRHLIHTIGENNIAEVTKPKYLRKGDVFISRVGEKKRPVVVIDVKDDLVVGFALSTTKNSMNMTKGSSRFLGEGYINHGLVTATEEFAMENFIGMYDNVRLLNRAIKEFKEFVNKL